MYRFWLFVDDQQENTCWPLWLASPLLTLVWVRLWSEVRRSATSWHTAEVAVGDAEVVPGVLVPLEGALPELQATASSPAQSATAAADHQAGRVPVAGLVFMPSHRPPGSCSRQRSGGGITRIGGYRRACCAP